LFTAAFSRGYNLPPLPRLRTKSVTITEVPKLNSEDNTWDYVGGWFEALELRGEEVPIKFGRVDLTTGGVRWYSRPHRIFDGQGALTDLFLEISYPVEAIPGGKSRPRPLALKLVFAILLYMYRMRPQKVPWKRRDPSLRRTSGPISWQVLSPERTTALEQSATRLGVSLNSLLLQTLHRAAQHLLTGNNCRGTWMVPVNLRPVVRRNPETTNHSSYLGIPVHPQDSPAAVQKRVSKSLKRGDHWSAWWGIGLGKRLGIEGIKKFYARYERRNHSWMGTMSNLGELRVPTAPETEAWILGVPATAGLPIGAGILKFNGRLALTLVLHRSVTSRPEEIQQIFDSWLEEVLAG